MQNQTWWQFQKDQVTWKDTCHPVFETTSVKSKANQNKRMEKRKCGNENATERFCLESRCASAADWSLPPPVTGNGFTSLWQWHGINSWMARLPESTVCCLSPATSPRATPLVKIKGHRPPPSPPLCLTAGVLRFTGFLVSAGYTALPLDVLEMPRWRMLLSSRSGNENLCTSAAAFLSLSFASWLPPSSLSASL